MNHASKTFLTTIAVVLFMAFPAFADADPAAQDIFKKLMAATVADDYDGFVAVCDGTMKAAITKPVLDNVSKQIVPRAKDGYDADYLGELNQRGYAVHLWRLRFKSGGDDTLATLSIKDGKAGGFYLH